MKTSVKMVACLVFLISLFAVSCQQGEEPQMNTVGPIDEPVTASDENKLKFEVEYEDDHGGGVGNIENWKVTNGKPTDPSQIPLDHIEITDIKIVSWNPTCIQIGSRVWCQ